MRYWTALLFIAAVSGNAEASSINCIHYWLNGTVLTPSGKAIGSDVGSSPYGDFGEYHCTARISEGDAREHPYLVLGEIGDASFFQVTSFNGIQVDYPVISHGLQNNTTSTAVYTRYIPFVIPIHDFFHAAGLYEFRIKYKDIVPLQVGMRSGPPRLEAFWGMVRRVLFAAPTFTYHAFQIFYLLFAMAGFLLWPEMAPMRRVALALASLMSAIVVLQISAIPRSFFSPFTSIRLTVLSQIIAAPFIVTAFLQYFESRSRQNVMRFRLIHGLISIISLIGLGVVTPKGTAYFLFFGVSLLFLFVVPAFAFFFSIRYKYLSCSATQALPTTLGISVGFIGFLYLLDLANLVLLHGRFYYFNHYIFYSGTIHILRRLQYSETLNEARFYAQIEKIKSQTIATLSNIQKSGIDPLHKYIKTVSALIGANRVSICEIVDNNLKFLGKFGPYEQTNGLLPIAQNSIIGKSIENKAVQSGRLPLKGQTGSSSDYFVLPIINQGRAAGVLSMTDFHNGYISTFARRRINVIQREVEGIVHLLLALRQNEAQSRLLQMIRLRTHHLQSRSEEFFLKTFDVSQTLSGHSFILGDLVDSTALNERYSGHLIEKVIDAQLEHVWKKFCQLGVVLTRSQGDSISILVPNLSEDVDVTGSANRCFQILRYLNRCSDDFYRISRSAGLALQLQYRWVMSRMTSVQLIDKANPGAMKPSPLLVDGAIDTASRALSHIAIAGECIILEPAKVLINSADADLLRLPAHRVKGRSEAVQAYSIKEFNAA